MGCKCLARPAGDPDRLDFRRCCEAPGDPAQLGRLRSAPLSARDADSGAIAKVSAKPIVFGSSPPAAPLGSWTLLDTGTMLAAPHCTSAVPNGEVRFVEDRTGPPSRAYLKLWEALTVIERRPRSGEVCLDLGSSPGGWSW